MAKSKDQIANDMYGEDYEWLSPGEKAAVTRAYNNQPVGRRASRPVARATVGLTVHIGRIGINGTKTCIVPPGSTVGDLLEQAEYELDAKKESILATSTGRKVTLSSAVVDNETYQITPEIKSA